MTYTVKAEWIWDDKRFSSGDTVDLTREQYDFFSTSFPGLFSPVETTSTRGKTVDPQAKENATETV